MDAAITIFGTLLFIAGLWIFWSVVFGNRDDYSYNLSFSGFLVGIFSFSIATTTAPTGLTAVKEESWT